MRPSPPGGRRQPPPVVVTIGVHAGPSGFGCTHSPVKVYPDVAWTKDPPPPPQPPVKRKVSKTTPPPRPAVVATDGSVGGTVGRGLMGGWAWVTPEGRADAGAFHTGDARVAELRAVAAACTTPELSGRPLHILCDSQAAIRIVQFILDGLPTPGVAAKYTDPIRTRADLTPISIRWVRGHHGNRLNETADRLALMARRRVQSGLKEGITELARQIAREEFLTQGGDKQCRLSC